MILVEGYTDVLALHQAGLGNAVGIMGTALTEEQISELERVAKVLVLCLDADRAGQEAMLRAAQLTDERNLELRVVPLPDGTDPAELIERAGADALRERVAASVAVRRLPCRPDPRAQRHPQRGGTRPSIPRAAAGAQAPAQGPVRRCAAAAGREPRSSSPRRSSRSLIEGAARETAQRDADRSGGDPSGVGSSHGRRAERTFLALCVALPDAGARTAVRDRSSSS